MLLASTPMLLLLQLLVCCSCLLSLRNSRHGAFVSFARSPHSVIRPCRRITSARDATFSRPASIGCNLCESPPPAAIQYAAFPPTFAGRPVAAPDRRNQDAKERLAASRQEDLVSTSAPPTALVGKVAVKRVVNGRNSLLFATLLCPPTPRCVVHPRCPMPKCITLEITLTPTAGGDIPARCSASGLAG